MKKIVFIPIYKPDEKIINRILSLKSDKYKIKIFLNSNLDQYKIDSLKQKQIKVIGSGKNIGLSKSANLVFYSSYETGSKYALFLDQDTRVSKEFIEKLFEIAQNEFEINEKVAIYSCLDKSKNTKVDFVRNSGSVFNLAVFEKIGGFDEKFFVDMIDYEYSIKIRRFGFEILGSFFADFDHETDQGNIQIKLFGRTIKCRSYNFKRLKGIYIGGLRIIIREILRKNIKVIPKILFGINLILATTIIAKIKGR